MDKFKTMKCEDCGQKVVAELLINKKEFLDGYHGECSFCGWRFWPCEESAVTDKKKILSYRNKVIKNKKKFLEAAQDCEFKSKIVTGIGGICKLEKRWTVTCDPEHCPL